MYNKPYYLSLYQSKNAKVPLKNPSQIKLDINIKDKTKPKCIDTSSVLQIKAVKNGQLTIYWSIPAGSFGNIWYKVIRDESKEEEEILSLPYKLRLPSVPVSFKVITLNEINGNVFESEASQTITTEYAEITSNIETNININNKEISYFMQITSIDEDEFHIEVICDKIENKKRILFIKDINMMSNEETKIEQKVVIKKGQIRRSTDIDIDKIRKESYYLALYDDTKQKALNNSNQILFVTLRNNELPSKNIQYTPKCIDLNTVLKTIDNNNKNINIYWSLPSKCFGDVSYKIIKNEKNEEHIISSLPFTLPLYCIPISFTVITICNINDKIYESEPSQVITVGYKEKINDLNIDDNANDTENID